MFDEPRQKSEIDDADWILGRPVAPITLLEYADFECPYCATTSPVLESLVREFPDVIRLVFRHFPLTTLHPHAARAAEAAETAGDLGRFWPMHDTLFRHQRQLDDELLPRYAETAGVDRRRFVAEMSQHAHQRDVLQDFRRGLVDGVHGTPTIFINRRRYDGARDRVSLLAAIERYGGRS
jgi:protein-disulfide isomerase